MALAGVESTICGDAGDLLFRRDLVEQLGQHGRVTDGTGGELGRPDFQFFLFDPNVDLAPDAPFRAARIASAPLAFALDLDLDARAVVQQMQRAVRAAIGDAHLQGLLAPRQRAEVRHRPVKADQTHQALDEPCSLAERHPKQHLHCQAGLDGGIAVVGLPPTLPGRRSFPGHRRVEPDGQRATALQRFVVGGPVLGLVGRGCASAHAAQLPRWIHEMNPSNELCNRAPLRLSLSTATAIDLR